MDISYLLFLQDLRNSIHDAWTPFMEGMSLFAITYLVLIPLFIYWFVNKRQGLYTLASFYLCVAVNAVIKLTACVYRPWIRDPRIIPAGNAISTAGGYSFPSGHTTTATPIYGGLAVGFWKNKKTKWLSVLCIVALLITGFSRNYLGVHTPQDVMVGMCLGILVLWAVARAFAYLQAHPEKENKFLLIGFLAGLAAFIYVIYKPYPMDYVNGKLLVDPHKMTKDAFMDIGAWMTFCAARYAEKRWVNFTPTGLTVKGIALGMLGLIIAALMIAYVYKWCTGYLGAHWGRLCYAIIFVSYSVFIYPYILKKLHKTK